MPARRKPKSKKKIETLTHEEASRKNIPTVEYEAMIAEGDKSPVQVAYERRNRDLDPQLIWRGKDLLEWSDLVVQAPPLYIQEKVHPKVLIDDLRRMSEKGAAEATDQPDLFADFNGLPDESARTEFYQHEANWSNRMILGDSLQVMASLAEREGLRGKVQCIYIDPPYGIKFNSNFQWSTTSRDVKDGKADHITREPEQVKAFRDTWRDGIHSYLSYLRDRLTVARDLLTDSGSVFVQIGDENVHRVRALMDEVFGVGNFVRIITFRTTTGLGQRVLDKAGDYIIWYCKDTSRVKYRQLFESKDFQKYKRLYSKIELVNGGRDSVVHWEERSGSLSRDNLPHQAKTYTLTDLRSQSGSGDSITIYCDTYTIKSGSFKTNQQGVDRLCKVNRLEVYGQSPKYIRYFDDFPFDAHDNFWNDQMSEQNKDYVVQTSSKVIQRCILMTTDPGDLVLDPTCGSGTTAYVAEQWGRRWITIDTSRVALALARARIMGARYPFYLLTDSKEGQQKESAITQTIPSELPTYDNIGRGFVYERVPHITLKSIANNSEIDVIWEKFQKTLEPLRKKLNQAAGGKWEEWEIPREPEEGWSNDTKRLHADWWQQRIARQQEIDASIAAKADYEYLYDKPYQDNRKVRVAGPFTVESLSPHRTLGVDEEDELIDDLAKSKLPYAEQRDFGRIILENLRSAGVQQAHKEDKLVFTSLVGWPGDYICAEGRFEVSGQWSVTGGLLKTEQKQTTSRKAQTTDSCRLYRAGIFIGPEFGTLARPDLVAAAREAADAGFDVLITCAFNYDARATDFDKLGKVPVLKARMNADLHMADNLKNTGKGNLFVIFGEPDISVTSGQWLVTSTGRELFSYDSVSELPGFGSLEEINRLGGTDLSRLKELSVGGEVRTHQSTASGGGIGSVEHRGRSSKEGDRGVSSVSERGERIPGGSGDTVDPGPAAQDSANINGGQSSQRSGDYQQNARWSETLAAIQALTAKDFPLSLTTSHKTQVTIHGVDVFHPQTGEVRSDGAEGIACWFIDTDYNEESFFVRQAYFLGQNDPYKSLKTTLKAEINQEAWETLNSDTSRPFDKPSSGRIAVKVINHLGDEVMKVYRV